MRVRVGYGLKLVAAFCLYFALGRLGLSVPFTFGNISPVWPSAGVALSLLLLWGVELWPAIAAAAFAVNYFTPIPAAAAAGMAVGNTCAAVCGAWWLRGRISASVSLSTLREVLLFVAFGALSSTMIAATVGTAALSLTGARPWSSFAVAWQVWWLGDTLGVLLVGPLLLTTRDWRRELRGERAAELLGLFASLTVAALAVFARGLGLLAPHSLPGIALFPIVTWAAIRFGTGITSATACCVALAAAWGTAAGNGPFIGRSAFQDLILMQFFLAIFTTTGLILAAIIDERRRGEGALRELSAKLLKLQDEERRRLVRELHDSTGQNLTALLMNLASVRDHAGTLGNGARGAVQRSMELAEEVVKDIRTLCCLFHPPLLDDVGLLSALRWYAESLEKRSDLRIELDAPENWARLSQELETGLFRVAQEAITNVLRHSGSSTALIRLQREPRFVRLAIVDKGRGRQDQPEGVGITGMRERVRELGGTLVIQSANPGTAVEVSVPLRRRSSRA